MIDCRKKISEELVLGKSRDVFGFIIFILGEAVSENGLHPLV